MLMLAMFMVVLFVQSTAAILEILFQTVAAFFGVN